MEIFAIKSLNKFFFKNLYPSLPFASKNDIVCCEKVRGVGVMVVRVFIINTNLLKINCKTSINHVQTKVVRGQFICRN